jgi:hypothetical protein
MNNLKNEYLTYSLSFEKIKNSNLSQNTKNNCIHYLLERAGKTLCGIDYVKLLDDVNYFYFELNGGN